MKKRAALTALAATLPVVLTPAPAHAAVPRIPITCGMVVRTSAHLYLTEDLYCPTAFGVRVEYPEPEGGPMPRVTVNLRGHTLRGPGAGEDSRGITAFSFPGPTVLRVTNGRVENWRIGVGGDHDTRVRDVKLVGNQTGFFCNGLCGADHVYFKGSRNGFVVGGEASAVVKHSTFSRNRTGVSIIGFLSSAQVERNTFFKNGTAIFIACNSSGTLVRNRFIKNGTRVEQQSCD